MTQVTTVTGLTADRMIEMEAATIIDGDVQGDNLHLQTRGGTDINAGNVRGPKGDTGANGTNGAGDFICTSTTRPTTSIVGYAIFETDTGLRRTWTGTRWKCQERVICTSTTKPTLVAADEGVYAYLQDVNYGQTWDGTKWVTDGYIVCTNATRPTLTINDEGVRIYETDTDTDYIWTGSVYLQTSGLPHELVYQLLHPAAATQNLNTTYIDYIAAAQGGPAQTPTFVKKRSDTLLIAQFSSGRFYVTTATGNVVFALRINAVDYPIAGSNPNVLTDCNVTGVISLAGLAAGSYTAKVRVKDTSPTAVVNYDPGTILSIKLTEAFA